MNKTMHTGRLTHTPELKQTPSGVSVCNFTLAVKRPRVKDKTDFINFVAWRGQAEFLCKYFQKGDPVEVVGELHNDEYKDKDGNGRKKYEIECTEISFCLTSGKAEQTEHGEQPPPAPRFEEINNDDDLPF